MKLRAALIFVLAVMLLGLSAWSQEVPKWEISLDYSYSHYQAVDYEQPNYFFGQHFDLEGGGGGVVYNFRPMIGFKAEFQGYTSDSKPVTVPPGYAYLPQGGTANVSGDLFTYMFGPELGKTYGKFRPFAEGLVGGAHSNVYSNALKDLNLEGVSGSSSNNAFAAAAGLGLDIGVSRRLSIRPFEVDYLYTNFSSHLKLSETQNSWRYVGGVVFTFGGKPPIPPTASCSVQPTEIMAGDPVTATMTTQDFNPKHTVTYSWSSTGGTTSSTAESANLNTTGLAPGSYTVTGTATDPKEKKNNTATCTTSFTVKAPRPPEASCSADPTTVNANGTSAISVTANSPDGRPLTYSYSATAGSVSGTGNTATLSSTGAPAGSAITVTANVVDDRGLSTPCTAAVNVLAPPPVTVVEQQEVGTCNFSDPRKTARVDNVCKAVLDDVALRLQREPNGRLVVVGYAEDEEVVKVSDIDGQRSVNIKYYLTSGESQAQIDASRIESRKGPRGSRSAKLYFVPESGSFTVQGTETVDESAVKGQSRSAPAPKHKPAAPPAQ